MAKYLTTDTDLTSVANAIRTKGGTSAQLAFPNGFVSAIGDIPTGGGSNIDSLLDGSITAINSTVTKIKRSVAQDCTDLVTVNLPNCTEIGVSSFQGCTKLESISAPACITVQSSAFHTCSKLVSLSLKAVTYIRAMAFRGILASVLCFPSAIVLESSACEANTHLTTLDIGPIAYFLNYLFNGCTALNTLILRKPASIVMLSNVNAFQNTPFANGGIGGTVYIPKALYDHLGDNSSLDYKAATNWSTVDGYGTITWAKIEGSYYETHYADGTEIPTT